jgi:hypothetical protein
LRLLVFGLVSILLMALFLVILLFPAQRTPMLVITMTNYKAPLPPNSWAREDMMAFVPLHRQTLEVVDISTYATPASMISNVKTALESAAERTPREALMLYISAYGALDGQGRSTIILPSSDPQDSSTWISLEALLLAIRSAKVDPDVNIVVVLDCNQLGANWAVGQLYPGFADGVRDAVRSAKMENLGVFTSAEPGQTSYSAPELHGTVFGYFMRLAIQGQADLPVQGGNGDRKVSFYEMTSFVRHHVSQWVRRHRYAEQTPLGFAFQDFSVAWCYDGRPPQLRLPQQRSTPRSGSTPEAEPPAKPILVDHFLGQPDSGPIPALVSGPEASAGRIPLDELIEERKAKLDFQEISGLDGGRFPRHNIKEETLDQLWLTLDVFIERGVYSRDPIGMERFRRDILQLEALSVAGPSYRPASQSLAGSLFSRIPGLAAATERTLPVSSIPQADLFGRISAADRADIVTLIDGLKRRGEVDKVEPTAEETAAAQTLPEGAEATPAKPKPPPPTASEKLAKAWSVFTMGPDPQQPPPRRGYAARVMGAWQVAQIAQRDNGPTLAELVSYIGTADAAFQPGLVEGQWLAMMLAHLDRPPNATVPPEMLIASLQTRSLAEQASVPRDIRAHHWLWSPLLEGDKRRLAGEDLLMLDPVDRADDITAEFQAANALFQTASQRASEASYALAVRDRAFWELTELACWLTRPLPPEQLVGRAGAIDMQVTSRLVPLIKSAEKLASNIEQSLADGSTSTDLFMGDAQSVDQGIQELREQFLAECLRLTGGAPADVATLHEIDLALRVGNIPAEVRRRLRWRRFAISERLVATQKPIAVTESQASAPPPPGRITNLDRIAAWGRHPALVLLEPNPANRATMDVTTAASDNRGLLVAEVAAAGEMLRQRLAEVPGDALADLEQAQAQLLQTGPDRMVVREGRGRADQLVRAVVGLSPYLRWPDAADRVLRSDLHQMLAQRSVRAMNDFYGPLQLRSDPFFATTVTNDLMAAQHVVTVGGRIEPVQDGPLRDRQARLLAASAAGLVPMTPSLPVTGLEPRIEREFSIEVTSGIPTGTAAVWIRDQDGPTMSIEGPDGQRHRRLPLAMKPDQAGIVKLPYAIDLDNLRGHGPRMEALSLYRGHSFKHPFTVETPGGAERRYVNPGPQPTFINVIGEAARRGSTVLVLDSSDSMKNPMEIEGPTTKPTTRLDVARAAVRQMMQRLVNQGRYNVGVQFYGHRVARYIQSNDLVARNPDWPGSEIPADLDPAVDVQNILTLGRFTEVQRQQVNERLDKLRPWGETPLFLAIREAIRDFEDDSPEHSKSIVVITDGLDYTFNPENPVSIDDVLEAMPDPPIPLYIVGFRLAAEDRAQAERDFGRLARETGGRFFSADQATTLAQALNATLLREVRYQVTDTTNNQQLGDNLIGEITKSPPRTGPPHDFKVDLQSDIADITQNVSLLPGQALEMFLSRDGRYLENRQYLEGDPKFSPPVPRDYTIRTRYVVGLHRPQWDGPIVDFPVSFQQAEPADFVPPPVEVWIEITPQTPRNDGQSRVYYDMQIEPRLPVAVVDCTDAQWPPEARRAAVRAWWKTTPTPPSESVGVGIAEQPLPSGLGRTVQGVTGMRYITRVDAGVGDDPTRVTVLETYDESAIDLNAVRVMMSPPPDAILRRVDLENRLIIHKFEYLNTDPNLVRDRYQLQFTTREDIQRDAYALEQPEIIEVPRMPDVLRP